jgi:hypothetical protein
MAASPKTMGILGVVQKWPNHQENLEHHMTNLVISLPDDTFARLNEIAMNFRLTPEELVFVSIRDLLEQPENEFQRITKYVLTKNAELYKRLA